MLDEVEVEEEDELDDELVELDDDDVDEEDDVEEVDEAEVDVDEEVEEVVEEVLLEVVELVEEEVEEEELLLLFRKAGSKMISSSQPFIPAVPTNTKINKGTESRVLFEPISVIYLAFFLV